MVEKQRFSAFTPGTSDLNAILREQGIDTVLITGTLTNCCCESTARDAMQHNYRVLIAADANAALTDEEHAATLHNMAFVFADLYSTDCRSSGCLLRPDGRLPDRSDRTARILRAIEQCLRVPRGRLRAI